MPKKTEYLSVAGIYARLCERIWKRLEKYSREQLDRNLIFEANADLASGEARALLQTNHRFKNLHRGQRAFIIGNGQSLQRSDLRQLSGEITFVASGFWKHPDAKIINPRYYLFADPLFFNGDLALSEFFSGLLSSGVQSNFFIPLSARSYQTKTCPFGDLPVNYVAFNRHMRSILRRPPDLCSGLAHVMNVVHLGIMIALYMGCNEIFLLGIDHDYLSHRGEDKHFYSDRTLAGHRDAKPVLAQRTYKEWMEIMLKVWDDYETLGTCCQQLGAKIYNATDGGFLDVFERKPLNEVMKKSP